jgi:hypothetical protein
MIRRGKQSVRGKRNRARQSTVKQMNRVRRSLSKARKQIRDRKSKKKPKSKKKSKAKKKPKSKKKPTSEPKKLTLKSKKTIQEWKKILKEKGISYHPIKAGAPGSDAEFFNINKALMDRSVELAEQNVKKGVLSEAVRFYTLAAESAESLGESAQVEKYVGAATLYAAVVEVIDKIKNARKKLKEVPPKYTVAADLYDASARILFNLEGESGRELAKGARQYEDAARNLRNQGEIAASSRQPTPATTPSSDGGVREGVTALGLVESTSD